LAPAKTQAVFHKPTYLGEQTTRCVCLTLRSCCEDDGGSARIDRGSTEPETLHFTKLTSVPPMMSRLILSLALFGAIAGAQSARDARRPTVPDTKRPRIIITTDPELDDSNSLVRFLLYSTDFHIEGLVYASSQFHWKGNAKGTKWSVPGREYTRFGLNLCPCTSWRWADGERYIDDAVEMYEKVYANLKVHNPDYPSPAQLKSKIRVGNIDFDGDISKDSPGSELIKSLILDDKGGPLYLAAWGGHSTIARALKSIKDEYENRSEWPVINAKVSRKVVLLPSGDQDNTYANYIKPNWPEIEYQQVGGGPRLGYGAQRSATPEGALYLSAAWMQENVSSRGPLGTFYRVWGDGKQMVKGDIFDYFGLTGFTDEELKAKGYIVWTPVQAKGSWLGEGDTPTFLNLLDNGLRAYEDGSWGGWGGRKRTDDRVFDGATPERTAGNRAGSQRTQPDFFPALQRDFAARLKWSVTPHFADANHEPKVRMMSPLNITAQAGKTVRLEGGVTDPDGDAITVTWWKHPDSSYPSDIAFANPSSAITDFRIPTDALPGQTIHLILEATDSGSPALTRYQRVVVTIERK
jgi:hypothetical protein